MKPSLQFTFYISILFALLTFNVKAQQNGTMESWSPSGRPAPFDWMFPTGWTTTNATSEFIGAGVTRSTDEHSGTYAAQIRTLNIFGQIVRSQLALGSAKLDFPNYQLRGYTGGEPLSMVPDQVSFYYKLTAGDSSEYAVADILIKRREAGQSFPDTVYFESIHLNAVSSYTEVNVPIPVDNINPATDSIVIVFSSNDTDETALNTLWIDDVSIDFASAVAPSPNQNLIVAYPNPVSIEGELHFTSNSIANISIVDATGKVVVAKKANELPSIDLSQTCISPGIYFIQIDDQKLLPLVVIE